LGAAWREVPNDKRFETVLEMIRTVAGTGMEVCCTMGMATEEQLKKMKQAGLYAYNHNIDTSREFYPNIVSTRTFDDRIATLQAARRAGVTLCSGGILGLGESVEDRAGMLMELANMNPQPESVPINILVPIKGTPLENAKPVSFEDFLRVIATARILMPRSRIRLSAGRKELTLEEQLECFGVGANSIFIGDKLLTTPNVNLTQDRMLIDTYESKEICATD
jgi:biotin synthase